MRCRAAFSAVVFLLMMTFHGSGLRAQGPDEEQANGAFAGMQRVGGEVTAVVGPKLTLKTDDGSTMQIVTTDNTRVMKDRGITVKVSDLKVGDGVMAAGNLDAPNKTLHAAIVFATDAAQLKAMRENLGKTYIAGRVKAIDMGNAKMTVVRIDGVAQTIGFDETTSFRKGVHGRPQAAESSPGTAPQNAAGTPGGESITLADIKVGDAVRGRGSLKGGVFVPTELVVMTPRTGAPRRYGTMQGSATGPVANPN